MKRVLIALTLACGFCAAQSGDTTKEAAKFYRLDFVVKDLDGSKLVSSRSYSMIVSNQAAGQVRAGSKVSVTPGGTYDVGTNVDCRGVRESQNDLSFQITVEVSSLSQDAGQIPVVRQNKWSSEVIVPLKKPTVMFSSDDVTTKHVLQLEVTATPR